MKKIIRHGVFETNSSSTHSVTIYSSKNKRKKHHDFYIHEFKNEIVTDNFDKLIFMIASNQFELSQRKLFAVREIFSYIDIEDDSNGYITESHYKAFDQLVQYKKEITKEIFEREFGKVICHNNSYQNISNISKILKKSKKKNISLANLKKLNFAKYNSIVYKEGSFVTPILMKSLKTFIYSYKDDLKLYKLIIDTYCEFTGENRDETIKKLKDIHKEYCNDKNFYCYTPLCTKFFDNGDLNNECVECDCLIESIMMYIKSNGINNKIVNNKKLLKENMKKNIINILNGKKTIQYQEYL